MSDSSFNLRRYTPSRTLSRRPLNNTTNANKIISVNSNTMAAMVDKTLRLGVITLPTLIKEELQQLDHIVVHLGLPQRWSLQHSAHPARPTGLSSPMFAALTGQDEMPSNVQLGRCGLPGRATEMGSSGVSSLLAFWPTKH
ncbi:hypothetical protein QR685DRAFT_523818 [Neurospora intermedia]|uniref:Uncharacterized protein n=1 Tax=Neurospora intermedia TaxID=5142 RepID=A0ABR3DCV4_NEUIN